MPEPWEQIEKEFTSFCRYVASYYEVDISELRAFLDALIEEAEIPDLDTQLALEALFGESE